MTAAELASLAPLRREILRPSLSRILRWLKWTGLYALISLILGAAALVIFSPPYQAGDAVGYNLGLAGSLMMLGLLLYPLRKRVRFLEWTGEMRSWFRVHMVTGVLGPLLVVFHSTFRTASINARVALYATLIVAGSGVIGRFVYRHIHSGLYGRKITLAEVEAEISSSSDDVHYILEAVPGVSGLLKDFHQYAVLDMPSLPARLWRFITLRYRAGTVADAAYRKIEAVLRVQAEEEHWSSAERARQTTVARQLIFTYVKAVCSATQFVVWERLFSLWHVLHVPLVYLLVVCAVIHVVAVHMY